MAVRCCTCSRCRGHLSNLFNERDDAVKGESFIFGRLGNFYLDTGANCGCVEIPPDVTRTCLDQTRGTKGCEGAVSTHGIADGYGAGSRYGVQEHLDPTEGYFLPPLVPSEATARHVGGNGGTIVAGSVLIPVDLSGVIPVVPKVLIAGTYCFQKGSRNYIIHVPGFGTHVEDNNGVIGSLGGASGNRPFDGIVDPVKTGLDVSISGGWNKIGGVGVVKKSSNFVHRKILDSDAVEAIEAGGVEEVDEFADGDHGLGSHASHPACIDFQQAESGWTRTFQEVDFIRGEYCQLIKESLYCHNRVAGGDSNVPRVLPVEYFWAEFGGIVEKIGGVGAVDQPEAIFVESAKGVGAQGFDVLK